MKPAVRHILGSYDLEEFSFQELSKAINHYCKGNNKPPSEIQLCGEDWRSLLKLQSDPYTITIETTEVAQLRLKVVVTAAMDLRQILLK